MKRNDCPNWTMGDEDLPHCPDWYIGEQCCWCGDWCVPRPYMIDADDEAVEKLRLTRDET